MTNSQLAELLHDAADALHFAGLTDAEHLVNEAEGLVTEAACLMDDGAHATPVCGNDLCDPCLRVRAAMRRDEETARETTDGRCP
jgi:hypothetical protein